MKVAANNLSGRALDWAVAKAEELYIEVQITVSYPNQRHIKLGINQHWVGAQERWDDYSPSTNWSQGGPIIERMMREGLRLSGYTCLPTDPTHCQAQLGGAVTGGATALIAATRCFVASKLGDEIDIPEELIND